VSADLFAGTICFLLNAAISFFHSGWNAGVMQYLFYNQEPMATGKGSEYHMDTTEPEIVIRKVRTWPEEEIEDLYREAGWWKEEWDASQIGSLIGGSFVFLVAIDTTSGTAVGMGRAISDGVSDAYLQDFVVHSAWRGRGIGSRMLRSLVEECQHAGIGWIGCIAEPGTESFYTSLGFERMEGHVPMLFGEMR
jgi:ribosomal protein S18 acetylase RimI-like enzyme